MFYYITHLSKWYFIDNINLIFHEAGHIIFSVLGNFIGLLGGTLMQILIPIVFSIYFFKNKQYFSFSLLLFWVSQNFFNIYIYAKDAIVMELPLLGGDNVYHDWNSLLSRLGILEHTDKVAQTLYFIGIIVLIFAIVYSVKYSIKEEVS